MSRFISLCACVASLSLGAGWASADVLSGVTPNPADVNLKLWLRADSGTGTGGTVATWQDSSNAGNNLNGYGTPTLQTATVGGKTFDVVNFSGSTDADYFQGMLGAFSNPQFTVFMVCQQTNYGGPWGNQKWLTFKDTGDSDLSWIGSGNKASGAFPNASKSFDFAINVVTVDELEVTGSDYNIYVMHYSTPAGVSYEDLYRDGVLMGGTNSIAQVGLYNVTFDEMTFCLSKRAWADSGYFVGNIAEVLVYSRALNDADMNAVGGYLEQRYNLDTAYVPVPEPSTLALLACGLAGLLCYAWRKRK